MLGQGRTGLTHDFLTMFFEAQSVIVSGLDISICLIETG